MKVFQGLMLLALVGTGFAAESKMSFRQDESLYGEGYAEVDYVYDYETNVDLAPEEGATPAPTVVPPKFDIDNQTFNILLGNSVDIPCTGADDNQVTMVEKIPFDRSSDPVIMNIDTVIIVTVDKNRLSFVDKTFTISALEAKDSAFYQCVYQYGDSQRVTVTHTLNVVYPPTMRKPCADSPCTSLHYVKEGESITIGCGATGNPQPNITWSKMETGEVVGTGSPLTLPPATSSTPGRYLCTAHNGIGKNDSVIREMHLSRAPIVEALKDVVRSGTGAQSSLQCFVKAAPAETSVTWQKEEVLLEVENKAQMQEGGHLYTLSLADVTDADLGNYTCTATNKLGTATTAFLLTDSPSAPTVNDSSSHATETSFTAIWNTDSFYPIKEVQLAYRLARFNESTDEAGEWLNSTVVAEALKETSAEGTLKEFQQDFVELEKDSEYEAVLTISNSVKEASPVTFTFFTLAPATTTTTTTTTAATEKPEGANKPVSTKDGQSKKQASGAASLTASSLTLALVLCMVV